MTENGGVKQALHCTPIYIFGFWIMWMHYLSEKLNTFFKKEKRKEHIIPVWMVRKDFRNEVVSEMNLGRWDVQAERKKGKTIMSKYSKVWKYVEGQKSHKMALGRKLQRATKGAVIYKTKGMEGSGRRAWSLASRAAGRSLKAIALLQSAGSWFCF